MHVNEPLPNGVETPTTPFEWKKLADDPNYTWSPIGLDRVTLNYPGEEWREHPVYDADVSNYGRVKGIIVDKGGLRRGFKPQFFTDNGHLRVGFKVNRKNYQPHVSRMVWEAFVGDVPERRYVLRTTGMAWDNRLTSLFIENMDLKVEDVLVSGEMCGRGHAITADNVVVTPLLTSGEHTCRSCSNAKTLVNDRKRAGRTIMDGEVDDIANAFYEKYTGMTVNQSDVIALLSRNMSTEKNANVPPYVNEPLPGNAPTPVTAKDWMGLTRDSAYGWSPIGLDRLTKNYPNEVWKEHPDYDFMVSNYGRVWGRTRDLGGGSLGFKAQYFEDRGGLTVSFQTKTGISHTNVSYLVWQFFRGEVPAKRKLISTTNMPWDNRLESLRVDTLDADDAQLIDPNRTCKRGHVLIEGNVRLGVLRKTGEVMCRACQNTHGHKYRLKERGITFTESDFKSRSDELYTKYTGLTAQ